MIEDIKRVLIREYGVEIYTVFILNSGTCWIVNSAN